jgi:hypothetical protein
LETVVVCVTVCAAAVVVTVSAGVVVVTVSAGAVTVAAGVVTVSPGVVTVMTAGGVVTVTGSPGTVSVTVTVTGTGLESVLAGTVSVVDGVVRVVVVRPVRVPVRSVPPAEPLPLPQLVSSTLDNTPRTPTTSSFATAAVYADDPSSQRLISCGKHRPAIRHHPFGDG